MILTINTTNREKIEVGFINNNIWCCFEFETKNQSNDLLIIISAILAKEKISLQNINALLVHTGSGSYTGVRIGVTTANTLAWSLNKPVYGFSDENLDKVLSQVIPSDQFNSIILPTY